MNRTDILDAARDAIAGRQEIYGAPENSFAGIAALWSAYLGQHVAPLDVALMMALLKIARAKGTPGHTDSLVDIAGYAACAVEARVTPPPAGNRWFVDAE